MTILITGAAGFVGFHVAQRLLRDGYECVGIDNFNSYYDVSLKEARQQQLQGIDVHSLDLADQSSLKELFEKYSIKKVIHLAAQAGVRYSIEAPDTYVQANLVGFANLLELCRHHQVEHFVYASSSSVYGANRKVPFDENDAVDHPISLYAASKKANELMAHTYSHLFRLPTTGLRFFTVYGPWGRPDMAYFNFTKKILAGEPIDVYNYGKMRRDFTYIDDIVEGIVRVLEQPPTENQEWDPVHPEPSTSAAPYRVYNIGNNQPVELGVFIETLERLLGKKAILEYKPMQPGDVLETYASIDRLKAATGFSPTTTLEQGLSEFVKWYRTYYNA